MTVVRIAVPVLQGRRTFHFDKGKPWTILEHILLATIAQKESSASELSSRANIPQRLIIEGLIRLMRAGWLQMIQRKSAVIFQATDRGLAVATQKELPNSTKRMSRKYTFIIEQITGGVFRSRELPYFHTHVLQERAKLEPIIFIDRPSQPIIDETRHLVAALFDDDEKFVGIDASGDRLAERWSLVTVRNGKVDGLTSRASAGLVDAISRVASNVKVSAISTPATYQAANHSALLANKFSPTRTIAFSNSDLVLGGKEHRDAIVGLLRNARHRVIIHSTFIDEVRFNELLESFRVAHSRGAEIDVMWGQDDSVKTTKSTRQAVTRIREALISAKLDRLRIHPFSTSSHCKIAIADEGLRDRYIGYIGSCNWLSTGFESFEASARLRDPKIVADLIDQLAELSRGSHGRWTEFTGELVALSAHLNSMTPLPAGRATASIVLGPQHPSLIHEARDSAVKRILVASHRFGSAAQPIVLTPSLAAAKQRGVQTDVFYGRPSGPLDGEDLASLVVINSGHGITIRPVRKPRLHAKILAWDSDSVVVTSQNWLSADPPDSNPRQEIGISLRMPGIARNLIERFEAARID